MRDQDIAVCDLSLILGSSQVRNSFLFFGGVDSEFSDFLGMRNKDRQFYGCLISRRRKTKSRSIGVVLIYKQATPIGVKIICPIFR